MRFRRLTHFAIAAAFAGAPVAFATSFAATTSEVHPGMVVVDPSGGQVGVVTAVKSPNLVLKTATHEVQLPLTSFTASKGKLMFGMTAAQLDAATEQATAAADAAVTSGAQVYGSDGSLAGTIEALDSSLVTIKLATGDSVRIPREGVGGGPKGATLSVTTAQLNQLASKAGASDASDGAGNATAPTGTDGKSD